MSTYVSTFRRQAAVCRPLLTMALAGVSVAALTLAIAPVRAQEVIDGGQTVTVPGDHASPWNLGADDLIVGETGAGTLVIENGGIVVPAIVQVGDSAGSVGTVTVSGVGSNLTSTGSIMQIGLQGAGTVTVSGGASLDTAAGLVVGHFDGGEGTLTVTGPGTTWTTANQVTVGSQGSGTVNLSGGASVTHGGDLTVGLGAHRNGYVYLSGAGTNWEATQNAIVGAAGNGDLWVEDGAALDVAQDLVVGNALTGHGYMTVAGADAKVTFGELRAGVDGYAYMWIEDGGTLGSAGSDVLLGVNADGEAGMQIRGAGSTFASNLLTVGDAGTASIVVSEGARLESGITTIGAQAGSVGEVSLSGPGTVWANTIDDIYIGRFGEGEVTVSGGAAIEAVSYVRLGMEVGSRGTLTLTGADTRLDAGVSVEIAKAGLGEFTVADGASVKHGAHLLIGQSAGAMGIAQVSGAGSSWQGLKNATIGESGIGTFAVTDGATASIAGNTVVGAASGGGVLWADAGTISTGTLTLGDAGDGTLIVENGGSVIVGGGTGTILAAAQAGSNGAISIGNGAQAGTIEAAKIQFGAGDGHIFFAHTDTDYRFDPILEGNASIEHGGGVTTLTADSAAFIGTTNIWGGTLAVDGALGGTVSVGSGATLAGTGVLDTVTVASGGTVAPGNSIGTLTVDSITFDAGSLYDVEVNGAGASDLVSATGTILINGGTVNVERFPDILVGSPYTILTSAGTLSGTFDGATFASGSLFITPTLTYDGSNAYVTLAQTTDFDDAALTPNQKAAAAGIQSVGAGEAFSAIAALGSIDDARAAFDAVSGEIHASAKTALIEDSRFVREAAIARVRSASDETQASASVLDGLEFWGHGFGSFGQWDGDGNAAGLERSIGGFVLGGDAIANDWRFGLLAGYSHTGFDVDDRASSGSAASYHVGAYGGTEVGGFGLTFGGAYAWHDVEIDRTAAFSGFADALSSDYWAGTGQVFGEVGYGLDAGPARFEPFANLALVHHSTQGFDEDGGSAALEAESQASGNAFTTLGVRMETDLAVGEGTSARLTGMIGWRHAFGDDTPEATLNFAGGDPFTVAGPPIARDALALEAGLDISVSPTASFGLAYSGEVASNAQDHGLKASFSAKF
jgi:outer membrane autotransporter protein